ncbi:hypothetical protein QQ045_011700 [Rhodiola kirilowii]
MDFVKLGNQKMHEYCLIGCLASSDSVVPNGTTYIVLINGLCKAEKFIEVDKVLVEMKKYGITPNTSTFDYCKISDNHKVIELAQMMAHRQAKLNKGIDDMVIIHNPAVEGREIS